MVSLEISSTVASTSRGYRILCVCLLVVILVSCAFLFLFLKVTFRWLELQRHWQVGLAVVCLLCSF